jgi:cytochrome P450
LTSGDLDKDRERVHVNMARYLDTVGRFDLPTALDFPVWVPGLNTLRVLPTLLVLRRAVARLVAQRMNEIERGASDFLDMLILAHDPKTGETLSRNLICDNVRTFIAGGHDSTGLALTWILYLLALHPEAESRVLGELRAEVGEATHSANDLSRLVYTRAVVNESLRLYPPFPFVSVRPLATVELCGRQVKPSLSVNISPWVVHRHRALWDEPDFFKPERFLPPVEKSIQRGAFIPFGLGPRGCVGATFAMQTILIVLSTVLPRFKVRLANAGAVFPEARVTLRPAGGLRAFVTPRQ